MHFDREALRGIYWSLGAADRELLDRNLLNTDGIKTFFINGQRMITDDLIQEEMVRLGFIIPFEERLMEIASIEYEEVMAAERLMEGNGRGGVVEEG